MNNEPASSPHGQLSVWDTVSIIIGIVIGSSIFAAPGLIFGFLPGPRTSLLFWLLCGLLSLVGALVYAELATTYPRSGGDYVYLTRAFGRPVGFLFGWAQLVSILSGSIGFMAFVFGINACIVLGVPENADPKLFATIYGAAAVAVISALNLLGVVLGKIVQNLLVLVKIAGVLLIVYAGVAYGKVENFQIMRETDGPWGVALILILYAYGGWNDAAFVAADLKNPRNITKALVLGICCITLLYLLVNAAYVHGLGYHGAQFNKNIATDTLALLDPEHGPRWMGIIVMVSALGAINGMLFTGSRVYASLGSEHRVFHLLDRRSAAFGAPIWAILIQTIVVLLMMASVGTDQGQRLMNQALDAIGVDPIKWDDKNGFDTLFAGTAPVFWSFFLLTGFAYFVLRDRDRDLPRPFKLAAPLWYPVLPMIFCATCIFGFYSAITYAKMLSLIGWIPLVLGIPLYFLSGARQQAQDAP